MCRYLSRILVCCIALVPAGTALGQDDDNVAVIDQIGQDNTGLINQTGRQNIAGSEEDPMLQIGEFNELEINQTGVGNQIGLLDSGLDQIGDSATSSIFNEILIDQDSNGNIVGSVLQVSRGSIPEGANRLIVQQGREDGGGINNTILKVVQEQLDGMPGQVANISQTGERNIIELVEQRSQSATEFKENQIFADIRGDFNGRRDLTGFALQSRAVSNSLIQNDGYDQIRLDGLDQLGSNGNFMSLLILTTADNNVFGIYQGGVDNSVGIITIGGSLNEIGLRQDGLRNDIFADPILGDENNIGIEQIGTNSAFLTLIGESSGNQILGLQEGTNDLTFFVDGDLNILSAEQGYESGLGGDNEAEFRVVGSSNFFELIQRGSNTAVFEVTGNFNNNTPTTAFSGDADLDPALSPGLFSQIGMGNDISVTIIGNSNLIAATQTGDANFVTAAVTGDLNQAAFIQNGSLNQAWLNQNGNGNIAGFLQ